MAIQVNVEVTDEFNDDVVRGLKLYRDLRHPSVPDETVVREWCSWFRDGAIGSGLFAIARDGEEIVGFHSLIPTEMRFGGRVVRGGKGEFFAVHPRYRRAVPPGSGKPLPLALVAELKSRARDFGFLASFGVSHDGAAFLTAATGGKAIPCEYEHYVTLLRPPNVWPKQYGRRIPGGRHIAWCVSTAARWAGSLRVRRTLDRLEVSEGRAGQANFGMVGAHLNYLVNPSQRMLAYRFPTDYYVAYTVSLKGRPAASLVFSRPRRGSNVTLMYWSTLDLPLDAWFTVLHEVASLCRKHGAVSLNCPLPVEPGGARLRLERLGFFRLRRRVTTFVSCYEPELTGPRDHLMWSFTNAHVRYYEEQIEA